MEALKESPVSSVASIDVVSLSTDADWEEVARESSKSGIVETEGVRLEPVSVSPVRIEGNLDIFILEEADFSWSDILKSAGDSAVVRDKNVQNFLAVLSSAIDVANRFESASHCNVV